MSRKVHFQLGCKQNAHKIDRRTIKSFSGNLKNMNKYFIILANQLGKPNLIAGIFI